MRRRAIATLLQAIWVFNDFGLPFVLTGLVLLWDRYRRRGKKRAVPREILLLSALSIWTHPTLDWMNSYGMRWLMPFDGTWFYGDSLFIVDPWLLIVLGLGFVLRSTAGALVTLCALLFVLPSLTLILPEPWNDRVYSVMLPSLAPQLSGEMSGTPLSPLQAGLVMLAYLVVALGAGALTLLRRDA